MKQNKIKWDFSHHSNLNQQTHYLNRHSGLNQQQHSLNIIQLIFNIQSNLSHNSDINKHNNIILVVIML